MHAQAANYNFRLAEVLLTQKARKKKEKQKLTVKET